MTYTELEVTNNEREFWEQDIRPRRALGLTRIQIARVVKLQPLEILKRIMRPRRAA